MIDLLIARLKGSAPLAFNMLALHSGEFPPAALHCQVYIPPLKAGVKLNQITVWPAGHKPFVVWFNE